MIQGSIPPSEIARLVNRPDPTLVEIGCNDGTDTRMLLDLFPRGRVYCFEPDPRARARFRAGARAQMFPVAVGAEDGTIDFHPSQGLPSGLPPEEKARLHELYPHGWDFSGSIRTPKRHLKRYPWCKFGATIPVWCVRLDTWRTACDVKDIDFIWADVQGAEADLIVGATTTLARTRFLYTEYNDQEMYEGQPSLKTILAMLPAFEVVHQYADDVLLRNTAL